MPEYFLLRPEVEKLFGYSHAVRIGDDLKISGAVSMDDKGVLTAPGSMEQQMENCYSDLEKILQHYGYTFANVTLEVARWTGAISNNWHDAENWNTGKVSTSTTHVIVATSAPNACVISASNANAASIQLRPGVIVNVINNRLISITGKCLTLPPN